jgi:hypothetical protein
MSLIDTTLSSWTPEERQYLNSFCLLCRTPEEVQMYFASRGYQFAIALVSEWLETNYPKGEGALKISQAAQRYRGVDPTDVLSAIAGRTFTLAQKIDKAIASGKIINQSQLKPLLDQAGFYYKESRAAARTLSELKLAASRREIGLAVAVRVCEILEKTFSQEDEQFKIAISHGIKGALMQVEEELN